MQRFLLLGICRDALQQSPLLPSRLDCPIAGWHDHVTGLAHGCIRHQAVSKSSRTALALAMCHASAGGEHTARLPAADSACNVPLADLKLMPLMHSSSREVLVQTI